MNNLRWPAFAVFCLAAIPRAVAGPENWNQWQGVNNPGWDLTGFTAVLQGNQASYLTGLNPSDLATDPFAYFHTGKDAVINVNYDPIQDTTTVEFTTTNPTNDIITSALAVTIGADQNPDMTNPPHTVHFGFDSSSGAPPGGFNVLSETWSMASGNVSPGILFNANLIQHGGSGTVNYMTAFLEVTAAGQQPVGQWLELPYYLNAPLPTVLVTDESPFPISATASYILSPTLIPLDDLNYQDMPPPGSSPSYVPGFTPPYSPSDWTTTTAQMVPEPWSLVMAITPILAGLACADRRRRLSRRGIVRTAPAA